MGFDLDDKAHVNTFVSQCRGHPMLTYGIHFTVTIDERIEMEKKNPTFSSTDF